MPVRSAPAPSPSLSMPNPSAPMSNVNAPVSNSSAPLPSGRQEETTELPPVFPPMTKLHVVPVVKKAPSKRKRPRSMNSQVPTVSAISATKLAAEKQAAGRRVRKTSTLKTTIGTNGIFPMGVGNKQGQGVPSMPNGSWASPQKPVRSHSMPNVSCVSSQEFRQNAPHTSNVHMPIISQRAVQLQFLSQQQLQQQVMSYQAPWEAKNIAVVPASQGMGSQVVSPTQAHDHTAPVGEVGQCLGQFWPPGKVSSVQQLPLVSQAMQAVQQQQGAVSQPMQNIPQESQIRAAPATAKAKKLSTSRKEARPAAANGPKVQRPLASHKGIRSVTATTPTVKKHVSHGVVCLVGEKAVGTRRKGLSKRVVPTCASSAQNLVDAQTVTAHSAALNILNMFTSKESQIGVPLSTATQALQQPVVSAQICHSDLTNVLGVPQQAQFREMHVVAASVPETVLQNAQWELPGTSATSRELLDQGTGASGDLVRAASVAGAGEISRTPPEQVQKPVDVEAAPEPSSLTPATIQETEVFSECLPESALLNSNLDRALVPGVLQAGNPADTAFIPRAEVSFPNSATLATFQASEDVAAAYCSRPLFSQMPVAQGTVQAAAPQVVGAPEVLRNTGLYPMNPGYVLHSQGFAPGPQVSYERVSGIPPSAQATQATTLSFFGFVDDLSVRSKYQSRPTPQAKVCPASEVQTSEMRSTDYTASAGAALSGPVPPQPIAHVSIQTQNSRSRTDSLPNSRTVTRPRSMNDCRAKLASDVSDAPAKLTTNGSLSKPLTGNSNLTARPQTGATPGSAFIPKAIPRSKLKKRSGSKLTANARPTPATESRSKATSRKVKKTGKISPPTATRIGKRKKSAGDALVRKDLVKRITIHENRGNKSRAPERVPKVLLKKTLAEEKTILPALGLSYANQSSAVSGSGKDLMGLSQRNRPEGIPKVVDFPGFPKDSHAHQGPVCEASDPRSNPPPIFLPRNEKSSLPLPLEKVQSRPPVSLGSETELGTTPAPSSAGWPKLRKPDPNTNAISRPPCERELQPHFGMSRVAAMIEDAKASINGVSREAALIKDAKASMTVDQKGKDRILRGKPGSSEACVKIKGHNGNAEDGDGFFIAVKSPGTNCSPDVLVSLKLLKDTPSGCPTVAGSHSFQSKEPDVEMVKSDVTKLPATASPRESPDEVTMNSPGTEPNSEPLSSCATEPGFASGKCPSQNDITPRPSPCPPVLLKLPLRDPARSARRLLRNAKKEAPSNKESLLPAVLSIGRGQSVKKSRKTKPLRINRRKTSLNLCKGNMQAGVPQLNSGKSRRNDCTSDMSDDAVFVKPSSALRSGDKQRLGSSSSGPKAMRAKLDGSVVGTRSGIDNPATHQKTKEMTIKDALPKETDTNSLFVSVSSDLNDCRHIRRRARVSPANDLQNAGSCPKSRCEIASPESILFKLGEVPCSLCQTSMELADCTKHPFFPLRSVLVCKSCHRHVSASSSALNVLTADTLPVDSWKKSSLLVVLAEEMMKALRPSERKSANVEESYNAIMSQDKDQMLKRAESLSVPYEMVTVMRNLLTEIGVEFKSGILEWPEDVIAVPESDDVHSMIAEAIPRSLGDLRCGTTAGQRAWTAVFSESEPYTSFSSCVIFEKVLNLIGIKAAHVGSCARSISGASKICHLKLDKATVKAAMSGAADSCVSTRRTFDGCVGEISLATSGQSIICCMCTSPHDAATFPFQFTSCNGCARKFCSVCLVNVLGSSEYIRATYGESYFCLICRMKEKFGNRGKRLDSSKMMLAGATDSGRKGKRTEPRIRGPPLPLLILSSAIRKRLYCAPTGKRLGSDIRFAKLCEALNHQLFADNRNRKPSCPPDLVCFRCQVSSGQDTGVDVNEKDRASAVAEPFLTCSGKKCSVVMHKHCQLGYKPTKTRGRSGMVCPQHKCSVCQGKDEAKLVRCRTCPSTFCRDHMPQSRDVHVFSEKFIACSRCRDNLQFPQTSAQRPPPVPKRISPGNDIAVSFILDQRQRQAGVENQVAELDKRNSSYQNLAYTETPFHVLIN